MEKSGASPTSGAELTTDQFGNDKDNRSLSISDNHLTKRSDKGSLEALVDSDIRQESDKMVPTSTKEKIQSIVDLFNLLDSVEKACFFHCIIPSMKHTDLENLKFSICLKRNVDGYGDDKQDIQREQEQTTLRRSKRRKIDIAKKDNETDGFPDDDHEPVEQAMEKVQGHIATRGRTRKMLAMSKPSESSKKETKIVKRKCSGKKGSKITTKQDDNEDTQDIEPVSTAPTLRKHTNVSFEEEDRDDVDDNYDNDYDDDYDNDYVPHDDKSNAIKATPRKSKKLSTAKSPDNNRKALEDETSDGKDDTKQTIEEDVQPSEANNRNPVQRQRRGRPPSYMKAKAVCDLICPKCGKLQKSKEFLAIHFAMKHMEKRYKCKVCNKRFLNETTLIGHELIHSLDTLELQCANCKEEFNTLFELKYHESNEHPIRNFSCPICSRSFRHVRSLQRHVLVHSGGETGDAESVQVVLEQSKEANGATGTSPAIVTKVVKGSDDQGDANDTASSLTLAVNIPLDSYICDLCGECFKQRSALWRHQKKHTGVRPHVCSYCGKDFLDKSSVIDHERIHTGEKPFPCDICSMRFTQKSQMMKHKQRIHLKIFEDKNILCDCCSKTFRTNSQLQRHYVIHTGEKPFPCKYCERRFPRTKDLVIHERTHTGERPYQCNVCGKTFADGSNFKVHEKTHTDGDPCPTCFRRFKNLREFRKHKKICVSEAVSAAVSALEQKEGVVEQSAYVVNNESVPNSTSSASIASSTGSIVQSTGGIVHSNIEMITHGTAETVSTLNPEAVNTILNLTVGQNNYYYSM